MKAVLRIEAIGDNVRQQAALYTRMVDEAVPGLGSAAFGNWPASCWVAEIVGTDPKYKWSRQFLRGKKDYSHANSVGSRGVYNSYILESGRVYEVSESLSWRRRRRYFAIVTDAGDVVEIDESEVKQWLKKD